MPYQRFGMVPSGGMGCPTCDPSGQATWGGTFAGMPGQGAMPGYGPGMMGPWMVNPWMANPWAMAQGMGLPYGYGQGGFSPGFGPAGFGPGRVGGGTFGTYMGGTPTDEQIRDMIFDSIDADSLVPYDADVDVDVTAGIVTLTGTVPNKRIKHAVGDDAWWVPGVWDINNNLEVGRRTREEGRMGEGQKQEEPRRTVTRGTTGTEGRATAEERATTEGRATTAGRTRR